MTIPIFQVHKFLVPFRGQPVEIYCEMRKTCICIEQFQTGAKVEVLGFIKLMFLLSSFSPVPAVRSKARMGSLGNFGSDFFSQISGYWKQTIAVAKSSSYRKLVTVILGCQSQHTGEKNAWLLVLGFGSLDNWYNARFLDLRRHGLIMCEFARFLDFRLRDVKSHSAFGGSSGG